MNYFAIKSLKGQVEHILSINPETRNSDVLLAVELWRKFYENFIVLSKDSKEEFVKLNNLIHLPSEAEIGRVRRKFQEKGKYLPTKEEVARQRKLNIDEWRIAMGYPTVASSGSPTPIYTSPSDRRNLPYKDD